MKQYAWLIPIFAIVLIVLAFVLSGAALKWSAVTLGILILALSYWRLLAFKALLAKKKTEAQPTQPGEGRGESGQY